jgi:hypothetical protein
MKRILLLSGIVAMGLTVKAQNVASGSTMDDASKWTVTQISTDAAQQAKVTFNYTEKIPTYGAGGAMRVTATNATANSGNNVIIWQPVTLKKDHKYVCDFGFLDLTGSLPAEAYWCQVYVDAAVPSEGADYSDEKKCLFQINTWKGYSNYAGLNIKLSEWDGKTLELGDTVIATADGTYTFGVKMGVWNADVITYDVAIDNLTLTDITTPVTAIQNTKANSISLVVSGNMLQVNNIQPSDNVVIYNTTGQAVKMHKGAGSNANISISDIPNGLYIVKSGNYTGKFVKSAF